MTNGLVRGHWLRRIVPIRLGRIGIRDPQRAGAEQAQLVGVKREHIAPIANSNAVRWTVPSVRKHNLELCTLSMRTD